MSLSHASCCWLCFSFAYVLSYVSGLFVFRLGAGNVEMLGNVELLGNVVLQIPQTSGWYNPTSCLGKLNSEAHKKLIPWNSNTRRSTKTYCIFLFQPQSCTELPQAKLNMWIYMATVCFFLTGLKCVNILCSTYLDYRLMAYWMWLKVCSICNKKLT